MHQAAGIPLKALYIECYMSQILSPDDLGEPALRIAGLRFWIQGRQFPGADNYDDGNWLRVIAHCSASGANVWVQGAVVGVTDIASFGKQCDAMLRGDSSSAILDPYEPELKISLATTDCLGHIRAQIEITPDHLTQSHKMHFELDQSYLPAIIKQCSAIELAYPVRGIED